MSKKQKKIVKEFIEKEFKIESLDDMANMFFVIAESIDHPIKEVSIALKKTFQETEQGKVKFIQPKYKY